MIRITCMERRQGEYNCHGLALQHRIHPWNNFSMPCQSTRPFHGLSCHLCGMMEMLSILNRSIYHHPISCKGRRESFPNCYAVQSQVAVELARHIYDDESPHKTRHSLATIVAGILPSSVMLPSLKHPQVTRAD